jgi:hypothetical protein
MKTTEQLASKFLRALEAEPKVSNQWSAKSAQEICKGLKFSNGEFQSVMDYAFHNRLIEKSGSNTATRVRFGENAEGYLSKNSTPFYHTWYGQLIFAVLAGLIVAFLSWKLGWLS